MFYYDLVQRVSAPNTCLGSALANVSVCNTDLVTAIFVFEGQKSEQAA